jgi:hypothetical protein
MTILRTSFILLVRGNIALFQTLQQDAEKRRSTSFPSSFVVATYIQVRLTPQGFACLREAASAKAGVASYLGIFEHPEKKLF